MNDLPDVAIKNAESLIMEGRLQEASPILAGFIRSHPDSAEGWFLLSFVAPERARQVECLERALKLDPGMPRASLRLEQLNQTSTPSTTQIPAENPPKVSPFLDNDFNFSDEGAFQPAPQAPKSWFDDLQTQPPQPTDLIQDYSQAGPSPVAPLTPEPQEMAQEPFAPAAEEDSAAAQDEQSLHLPEVEELVESVPPERQPKASQLTRDQRIWIWVGVIVFFLLMISFGILYIGTQAVLPTPPG